tara:strand:+ start:172 stop:561 length:390 start_codon:yes stop_codon:yes gene_type:complete
MANKIQRAWYVDKLKRIGIVEKGTNAVTKDGYSTDWKSITEAKDLRVYAISLDEDLVINTTTGTYSEIPEQFHEVILYKAIATGYKDPRNMEINNAQYFDQEYMLGLKEAKKFSRSNYQTTGRISQQDF